MEELAERNGRGLLSESERQELEAYVNVGQVVAIIQAKARVSLKHNAGIGTELCRLLDVSRSGKEQTDVANTVTFRRITILVRLILTTFVLRNTMVPHTKRKSSQDCIHAMAALPTKAMGSFHVIALASSIILVIGCIQVESPINGTLPLQNATEIEDSIEKGADDHAINSGLTRCIVDTSDCEKKLQLVMVLLGHGANADTVDDNGRTALVLEATKGCVEVMRLLLHEGADVNYSNPHNGETALLRACEYGRFETVKFLIANGADASLSDDDGRLPIHLASGRSLEMCDLVLGVSQSYINTADRFGLYPLFEAVMSKISAEEKLAIIQLLIEAGANPHLSLAGVSIPDSTVGLRSDSSRIPNLGETAIEFANRNEMTEIAEFMEEQLRGVEDKKQKK